MNGAMPDMPEATGEAYELIRENNSNVIQGKVAGLVRSPSTIL